MKRKEITKEEIVELYINQNLPASKVRKILGICNKVMFDYLKEYQIEKTLEQKYNCRSKWTHKYNDDELQEKVQDLYINQQLSYKEVREKLKISGGKLSKMVKKLGYKRPMSIILTNMKKTCIDKYGVPCSLDNKSIQEKVKETLLKKYGVDNYTKSKEYHLRAPEIHKRIYETQKKNGTLYKRFSKKEEQAYQLLLTKFNKEDIIRQYKSEVYPFNCDFYIKSLDLYIECQFSQYHGPRLYHCPFNPKNKDHLKQKSKLKQKEQEYKVQKSQYTRMLKVWTIEDPLKRKTAKENNLNWKEFFSLEELKEWLDIQK